MEEEKTPEKELKKKKKKTRGNLSKLFLVLFIFLFGFGVWHSYFKPLPERFSKESETYLVKNDSVDFLHDLTFENSSGERVKDQEIFDRIFRLVDTSEEYILIDMFLFNNYMGSSDLKPHRKLYEEMIEKLISKKENNPDIKIDLITDPINRVYSGAKLSGFNKKLI